MPHHGAYVTESIANMTLDSAADLFADKGFGGVCVEELTRAAGVNKAMPY